MAMPILDINFVAVVVAGIVSFVIGMIWYAPPVFGKKWMAWSGVSPEGMKKNMVKSMIGGVIICLVMAFVLAHIIGFSRAATIEEACMAGFWIWLGFFATTQLGMVLWEGKSMKLYALNTAHYLVVLIVASVILVLM